MLIWHFKLLELSDAPGIISDIQAVKKHFFNKIAVSSASSLKFKRSPLATVSLKTYRQLDKI